ncbi:putative aminoglycoside phosphotransferase [Frankia canadensis]|uniref:Putative aminoglycoside phosphotransferase n=1 Tax=Frankia canadensis TaxID=1836972 RepID=A0A2I2KUD4_9ACTN|nr:phosphotransferase family protein [Frankia canadensis]SNQ49273.1 putative aminoglycoside phosphotransferase [Frankia canadensis]SOU56563.1 putative aminoglycoside phosphotransferase [Frankia canadensis]
MGDPRGLVPATLSPWLSGRLPAVTGDLRYEPISGGHSNITVRVLDDGGHAWVLRRPPLGDLPKGAHDVLREARIMAALAPTDVPVPHIAATCDDVAVTGAPFYVMDFAAGAVVANPDDVLAALPEPASRRRAGMSLIDTLARLHRVDIDQVGLGGLADRGRYVERLLARMSRVLAQTRTRDLPLVDDVGRRLASSAPPSRYTGLVHADYRLGNVMLAPDGTVVAVLDWELTTVGDVLADLGFLINNWELPSDDVPRVWMETPPTRAGGFPDRDEAVRSYARTTGFDVSDLPWYRAFSAWRMSIIAEGIKARYESRAMSSDRVDLRYLGQRVLDLAAQADALLTAA